MAEEKQNFEDSLRKLEQLVSEMESGQLPLDEMMRRFEEGQKLAASCTRELDAIRRRIGLAQTLLISSDYSATRIATMVGYDNTNYFNSLFTRIVGTTPIRYRKKYLESLHGERDQT